MFVGLFFSLCPISGSREGMFSQDLYQRAGLWLDKRVGCFACRMTRKKKMEKREGRVSVRGRPFSALLLFHFIGPPNTHPHTDTHTQIAEPTRQSQEVTSPTGREGKYLFSLLVCCLFS